MSNIEIPTEAIIHPSNRDVYVRDPDGSPIWYRWDFYCRNILKVEEKLKDYLRRKNIRERIKNNKFKLEYNYRYKYMVYNSKISYKIVKTKKFENSNIKVYLGDKFVGTISWEFYYNRTYDEYNYLFRFNYNEIEEKDLEDLMITIHQKYNEDYDQIDCYECFSTQKIIKFETYCPSRYEFKIHKCQCREKKLNKISRIIADCR